VEPKALHILARMGVFGEEPELDIKGFWMIKG